ncbi:MAG: OsmC family protein [Bacteroidetes bacterium]|nr:OsmC family protein [Bacteroidota bacterium]
MKRTATAVWSGTGKEGKGHLSSQSGVLAQNHYAWNTRFEESKGTNPEELIAAAHAGCFAMKLSFVLGEAGATAESIEASATVTLEGGSITTSHLVVKAKVPGITKEKFEECAQNAKANCPVSKVLNLAISMEAVLV